MGLFDIFTGNAYKEAAQQQRAAYDAAQTRTAADIGRTRTEGLGYLGAGAGGALGAIGPAFAQGRADIMGGVQPGLESLFGYTDRGAEALTRAQPLALADLAGGVQNAVGAYDPLAATGARFGAAGAQTSQALADALGLNGPEGIARSQNQFQAGPGYQFSVDQGINALTRAAAAGGMGAGGNVLQESQKFGQGLANQEFNNWRNALATREQGLGGLESGALGQVGSGRANAYLTGGTGAANIYTGTGSRLADLYGTTGRSALGAYTGTGQSLADLASRGGLAEAGVFTGTGQSQADLLRQLTGLQTGFTQNITPQIAGTYGTEAAAQTGGSANLWNLIGGLGKLASSTGTGSSFLSRF